MPQVLNWLRSGLWAGHGRNCMPLASLAATAIFEVCGLALSSWKMPLPRGKTFRMVGNACRRRVLACTSPVTEAGIATSGPRPLCEKHPQNMMLGLCLTVVERQEMSNFSEVVLQTRCSDYIGIAR